MKQKPVERKFKAYSFKFQEISNNNEELLMYWDFNIFSGLIQHIMNQNIAARLFKRSDDWVMRLEKIRVEPDLIFGAFYSARIGDQYDLFDTQTLITRENPKKITEGEDIPSHFMIRKKDGFLLIEDRQYLNRISHARIRDYFEVIGNDFLSRNHIRGISIETLMSKDFLKEILKLDKKTAVEIQVLAAPSKNGNSEVIQTLREQANLTNSKIIKLYISSGQGRIGLLIDELKEFLNPIIKSDDVLSVKVVGRKDGRKNIVKLSGCEETYIEKVKVNKKGLTNSDEIYKLMKNILDTRRRIE